MLSRVPAGDILCGAENGGAATAPPPVRTKTATASGTGGHSAAILPKAKTDREKLRRTLMTEFRRQLPGMLECSGRDAELPERSLTVIRMLTRLDLG